MDRLSNDSLPAFQAVSQGVAGLFVDAGVGHIRLRACDAAGTEVSDVTLPSNRDLRQVFAEHRVLETYGSGEDAPIFITGKLAPMVRTALGCGKTFLPSGALWLAAQDQMAAEPENVRSLAMLEISASGYMIIGVDKEGKLKDDLLVVNPRCGAGTGVNIDRVLQKLGLAREEVDTVLAAYLGEEGKAKRDGVTTRADRCGVFGSSATISDKNQGIPLAVALATTLKSEVLKTCRKLPAGFDKAMLTGRFFRWQFVRDCAEDYLHSIGITNIAYDTDNTLMLTALQRLVARTGVANLAQTDPRLSSEADADEYPAFAALKADYEAKHLYLRQASESIQVKDGAALSGMPVHIGLDVGSTMAKIVMADDSGETVFLNAYSNAGDTIETIKHIFDDLKKQGVERLAVRSIGITGSARYQVQEALSRIYPSLGDRVAVLVENYAHARGSIDQARQHLARLKEQGVEGLNEGFCVLVDIGGEDTKISTLALKEAELFNNAMNIKCSAGTGSLMDTLSALFGIPGAGEASRMAFEARRGFGINATCAVFLMENAQKLQAQGVPQGEILASANWAIVENMARTLWNQVDLPHNTVVLLHGQTMLSDPLPLAVTHRLQTYLGQPAYALVPPYPGHRACFGLIRTMLQSVAEGVETIVLDDFIASRFEKRIIQCKGAACEDPDAVCNRTSLKCQGTDGKHFTFTLGGCSAINELFARAKGKKGAGERKQPKDAYKEIWDFIDSRQPKSDDPNRLVIPRSFVVSEWAYFLSQIFEGLGLPVYVDNVQDKDLITAQPLFNIDSCAPHMGAVGQYQRLAGEAHGMILVPQIEKLGTGGKSMGRTCTLNQGGVAVAKNLGEVAHKDARFHMFNLSLEKLDAGFICDQVFDRLQAVFAHYGISPSRGALESVIEGALARNRQLKQEAADLAARLMQEAMDDGFQVAVVVGREYILNPGIYDSHVRRLLRDKHMVAIPSYVLDAELDESFGNVYWRNPHFIVSVLNAIAHRKLHERLRHDGLKKAFQRIESGETLLPVVQISTFCCGPDSVTSHLVSEIMKKRPFLLIQSDAIIKELAHLENRVNTYVRQLELGLHGKLKIGEGEPFEVTVLDELENRHPIDKEKDVIYFPTMSDNRVLTSVLRGAGFTCIDNYHDEHDLEALIKSGRKASGDAVCAPLAGVYGDLLLAVDDFVRRREAGELGGKQRLLFFNNKGTGPCRQGQYVEVHKLLAKQEFGRSESQDGCGGISGGGMLRFLVANESEGYDFGIEEWTLFRAYQGVILQGVLHQLLFAGGSNCRDFTEYQAFLKDYRALKEEIFGVLEAFHGPGSMGRALVKALDAVPGVGYLAKYFAYRLHGRDMIEPVRRFASRWLKDGAHGKGRLQIHVSGEVYMRIAQGEGIFRTLLANLGFQRFDLELAPVWSYLEYLVEEAANEAQDAIAVAEAAQARDGENAGRAALIQENRKKRRNLNLMSWMLRNLLAKPLYEAAGAPMPKSIAATMDAAKEVLPTLRPQGELAPYVGEALLALREGVDLFLNVAPSSCMVSAMGEVVTPRLLRDESSAGGRIQHLFSAEGEVNDELLTLAVLKSVGPERYFRKAA